MAKSWQSSEVSYLKRYAGTKTLRELAQRFDTDTGTVTAKLSKLGISAKDQKTALADPVLESYEKALGNLSKEKWEEAAKLFEQVVADSDQPSLTARARQYLAVCRARLMEAPEEIEDDYLHAVFLKNQGDYERAKKLCQAKKHREDERFLYLLASLHALEERPDEAEEILSRAIELNPENRVYAFHDPDFGILRERPESAALFGLA